MVQVDTNSRFLRLMGVGFITLGLVGTGLSFVDLFPFSINFLPLGGPLQLMGPLLVALLGWGFIFLSQRQQRLEVKRQLAAQSVQQSVPMAAEQPHPNGTLLPLPYTIRLGPRWGVLFLAFLLMLLLLAGLALLSPSKLYLPTLLITLLVSVGGVTIITVILVKSSYTQIEVTETSLRVIGYPRVRHFVQWETAQLFAILPVGLVGSQSQLPVAYELSSADEIVRWTRVRRNRPFSLLLFCKPTNSFEEYDRQMDSLLAHIAAKTGLPLYDLR